MFELPLGGVERAHWQCRCASCLTFITQTTIGVSMTTHPGVSTAKTIRMFPTERSAVTDIAYRKIEAMEKELRDEKSAHLRALRIESLKLIRPQSDIE